MNPTSPQNDPAGVNNHIPENIHHIHMVAVCGTGMGALAGLLKQLGYRITGSDHKVYPPMSTYLADQGIAVLEGFHPDHLNPAPDLVVIGNAVSRGNPEAEETLRAGLPFCSMPQALNHFAGRGKRQIVVTGTHGKTTTASLIAWLLTSARQDPSFFIGGILNNFGRNHRLGQGRFIVIEGDEYDTAFFDKGPKFLHYTPDVAVLTSVEFDHADIYRDLEHVCQTFAGYYRRLLPPTRLLACDGDANIDRVVAQAAIEVQRYGRRKTSSWRLGDAGVDDGYTRFEVIRKGHLWGEFRTPLLGEHNLHNALAAMAAAHCAGVSQADMAAGLETFQGVKRRQEIRGTVRNITVVDDFAHHPTAVKETVRAMKSACTDGRLIAVFEPRTNTSMRNVFQSEYRKSFDRADLICVREPPLLEKIPSGDRFSSRALVRDLKMDGKAAHYFPDTAAIVTFLADTAEPGDLILVMSNGGFDGIHQKILKSLSSPGPAGRITT